MATFELETKPMCNHEQDLIQAYPGVNGVSQYSADGGGSFGRKFLYNRNTSWH
ncbi:hypothetical protein GCM10028818_55780 [Spirosoma horti]